MIRALISTIGLAVSQAAIAQKSDDYARMSRTAWAAFECSSLASILEKPKEQERLFLVGYDRGKEFIGALRAKKIKPEDLHSIAPSGFLMLAQGPTPDFILGRVFESAQENVLKDVITGASVLDKDLQQSIASRKFTAANCEVLGNGR